MTHKSTNEFNEQKLFQNICNAFKGKRWLIVTSNNTETVILND